MTLHARRRARRRRERGIALIMVMGAVALMTVMLAESQDDASSELASATADRDGVQAEYMARSAVNLSRLIVATEPTIRQALTPIFAMMRRTPPQLPIWNFSDQLLGAFNDAESAKAFAATTGTDLSLGKNLGMPGGRFEVRIVDEDAKINVNLAGNSNPFAHIRIAQQLMALMAGVDKDPLFEKRDKDGQYHTRFDVCSALIDWADIDEDRFNCDMRNGQTSGGPEDAFYQLLAKPYRRKNAPYDSLEELHRVRGVTDDFWATFVDPSPDRPDTRTTTVWGTGAVNINTAPPLTLLALICADPKQADICSDPAQSSLFVMGVTMARAVTMGAPMFGSAADFVAMIKGQGMLGPLLAGIGLKPVVLKSESEFAKSIGVESKFFSIYATGIVKGYKRETRTSIHAVVDFSSALPLSSVAPASTSTTPGAPQPVPTPARGAAAGAAGLEALAAAMRPSTGGQVVYYRIE